MGSTPFTRGYKKIYISTYCCTDRLWKASSDFTRYTWQIIRGKRRASLTLLDYGPSFCIVNEVKGQTQLANKVWMCPAPIMQLLPSHDPHCFPTSLNSYGVSPMHYNKLPSRTGDNPPSSPCFCASTETGCWHRLGPNIQYTAGPLSGKQENSHKLGSRWGSSSCGVLSPHNSPPHEPKSYAMFHSGKRTAAALIQLLEKQYITDTSSQNWRWRVWIDCFKSCSRPQLLKGPFYL